MTDINNLITDNIDVWTSAIKKKSATGRGSSKKIELTGIKKLRELILELAVRGKLVPQVASDEPASVLLEKIAEEKAQLIADKKIKKTKALPELTDEGKPFDLPNGWEWCSNLALFFLTKGKKPKNLSEKNIGFPYLDIEALDRNNILRFTDDEKCPRSSFRDLIVVCDGSRSGLVLNGKDGVIGSTLAIINTPRYIQTFIKLFFQQAFQRLNSSMKGAAIPHLDTKALREGFLALPPLAEQHRIVAKVDELMALCDQLEQQTEQSLSAHQTLVEVLLGSLFKPAEGSLLPSTSKSAEGSATENKDVNDFQASWQRIAEYFDVLFTTEHSIEQLKQTILQLAVMGKLVPQNPNDEPIEQLIDKLYEEQCARKLSPKEKLVVEQEYENSKSAITSNVATIKARFICDFITKGTTPSKPELLESGEVPFLKVYNIVKNQLDFAYKPIFISAETNIGKLKRSRVFPNDVIMNIVGPPLGKVAVITDEYPEWNMNQALAVFRPLAGIDSQYLFYMLPTDAVLASVLKEAKGTAGQDNLSLEQCRDLLIPIPSIKQQHKIVKLIEELMALCEQLKARLSDAQTTQLHLADAAVENALT